MNRFVVSAVLLLSMGFCFGTPSPGWAQDAEEEFDDWADSSEQEDETGAESSDEAGEATPEDEDAKNPAGTQPVKPAPVADIEAKEPPKPAVTTPTKVRSSPKSKPAVTTPPKLKRGPKSKPAVTTPPKLKRGPKSKPTAKKLKGKKRLVEMLVKNSVSVKRIKASDNEEAKAILAAAQSLYDEAVAALEADDLEKADEAFGEAMRKVGAASRMVGRKKEDSERARERFASLKKSVANSIKAIDRTIKIKGPQAAEGIDVPAIQTLLEEGLKEAESENFRAANVKLAKARNMANEALKKLRHKDTVIDPLKFDSPEDEYKYVVQRNANYKTLVQMMIKEKNASESKQKRINGFVAQSDAMLPEAKALADEGKYNDAVKIVDAATKNLSKALRSLGIMVFD